MLVATVFGGSDAIGVGLVVSIVAGVIAVMWNLHRREAMDSRRHHELDKRLALIESSNLLVPVLAATNATLGKLLEQLERRERAGRSGIYDKDHV